MAGTEEIIAQLSALSYAGIWLTSFLANVVIPVPEEIILLVLGYLSATGKVELWILIPLVLSGLLLSDYVLYTLSKKGNKLVTLFYTKFFAKRIERKGTDWLESHIGKIIFFSRFMVQLRFIGPFLAGQRQLPARKFLTYDFLALIIYVPLFLFLGSYFHRKIKLIVHDVAIARNIILLVVGVLIIVALAKFAYKLVFKPKKKEVSQ